MLKIMMGKEFFSLAHLHFHLQINMLIGWSYSYLCMMVSITNEFQVHKLKN